MTEIEKRRIKLLHETRKTYSDKYVPPAVHPRYQSAYHSLYGEENVRKQSTFGIRLLLAIFIFIFFCTIHYQEKSIGNINGATIVQEIQREYLFR